MRQEGSTQYNMEQQQEYKICGFCSSTSVHKDGTRGTSIGRKQRWLCKSCNHRFIFDPFPRLKATPAAVVLAMDLSMKGLSYRSIQDTIKQFLEVRVTHVTIMRWVNTGMNLLNEHLKDLKPNVSERWLADEQVAVIKNKRHYIWNCMDSKTRLLLATRVTKTRNLTDARNLFKEAKYNAGSTATKVVTDAYPGYERAVNKEFSTRSNRKPHREYGLKQRYGANHRIERYHGSFRQRDKVMRGFKTKKGANRFSNNFKTYYNYFRKHSTLGMTPAQAAGLNVSSNWKDVILETMQKPAFRKSLLNSRFRK